MALFDDIVDGSDWYPILYRQARPKPAYSMTNNERNVRKSMNLSRASRMTPAEASVRKSMTQLRSAGKRTVKRPSGPGATGAIGKTGTAKPRPKTTTTAATSAPKTTTQAAPAWVPDQNRMNAAIANMRGLWARKGLLNSSMAASAEQEAVSNDLRRQWEEQTALDQAMMDRAMRMYEMDRAGALQELAILGKGDGIRKPQDLTLFPYLQNYQMGQARPDWRQYLPPQYRSGPAGDPVAGETMRRYEPYNGKETMQYQQMQLADQRARMALDLQREQFEYAKDKADAENDPLAKAAAMMAKNWYQDETGLHQVSSVDTALATVKGVLGIDLKTLAQESNPDVAGRDRARAAIAAAYPRTGMAGAEKWWKAPITTVKTDTQGPGYDMNLPILTTRNAPSRSGWLGMLIEQAFSPKGTTYEDVMKNRGYDPKDYGW